MNELSGARRKATPSLNPPSGCCSSGTGAGTASTTGGAAGAGAGAAGTSGGAGCAGCGSAGAAGSAGAGAGAGSTGAAGGGLGGWLEMSVGGSVEFCAHAGAAAMNKQPAASVPVRQRASFLTMGSGMVQVL